MIDSIDSLRHGKRDSRESHNSLVCSDLGSEKRRAVLARSPGRRTVRSQVESPLAHSASLGCTRKHPISLKILTKKTIFKITNSLIVIPSLLTRMNDIYHSLVVITRKSIFLGNTDRSNSGLNVHVRSSIYRRKNISTICTYVQYGKREFLANLARKESQQKTIPWGPDIVRAEN